MDGTKRSGPVIVANNYTAPQTYADAIKRWWPYSSVRLPDEQTAKQVFGLFRNGLAKQIVDADHEVTESIRHARTLPRGSRLGALTDLRYDQINRRNLNQKWLAVNTWFFHKIANPIPGAAPMRQSRPDVVAAASCQDRLKVWPGEDFSGVTLTIETNGDERGPFIDIPSDLILGLIEVLQKYAPA